MHLLCLLSNASEPQTGLVMLVIFFMLLVFVFSVLVPIPMWITARRAGVKIELVSFIAMRMRGVNPVKIVLPLIEAAEGGLKDIDIYKLEALLLAGGNPSQVVTAMVIAGDHNIPLNFNEASAIDLAGFDILTVVTDALKQGSNKICLTDKIGIAVTNREPNGNIDIRIEDRIIHAVCRDCEIQAGSSVKISSLDNNVINVTRA